MSALGIQFQPIESTLLVAGFILAVLGLRALFRFRISPRLAMLVWTLVGLRLLIPFSVPERFLPEVLRITELVRAEEIPIDPRVTLPHQTAAALLGRFEDRAGEIPEIAAASARVRAIQNERLLFALWLLVALGILVTRQFAAWATINRLERGLSPVQDFRIVRLARRCAWESGRRSSIPIRFSSEVSVPFCYGILRPRVVLPQSMRDLGDEQLRHIFIHELGHIKRRDLLRIQLWEFALALNWFNPLAWFAHRAMLRDQELACDAFVYHVTGREQASAYAETLIAVASRIAEQRRFALLTPGLCMASQRGGRIRERIEFALDSEQARPSWALGILILLSTVLLLPTLSSHRLLAPTTAADRADPVEALLLSELEARLARSAAEYPEVSLPLPTVDMRQDWREWSLQRGH